MDLTPFFKEIAQGGVMGALTVVVFYIARRDYLQAQGELVELLKESKEDKTILVNLVKENIAGITALTKVVENFDNHKPYIGVDRRKQ